MKKILITTEYITLGQFLKLANVISSGSQAKFFLLSNNILVNDTFENRRGRKLYHDDKIKIQDEIFQIVQQNKDN
ncbi:S4 domain-containing protein YaaA [Ureaplasma miroungigenitalium]|uniref:S4 domain-containing protein YaaA n=1 Tax=Ureaplasma miroungigenitalium TaxID=1042321 RepID=A0ABT3BN28_9BACT|nr:S4 domain-containing protein YaaA [Ureaplasma miroungigenitalium]MCV3728496.1 S4 domain-containing protein YaaA [Ureaplasma miroungigenitalium]MCV3734283.1 S4 domain-containing protein YaaA [Ureaplasma miroungigenitalium]